MSRLISALLYLCLLLAIGVDGVFAGQTDPGAVHWSAPQAVPNVREEARGPFGLLADAAGRVHLIYTLDSAVTYHLLWDGERWTPPNDIFVSGSGAFRFLDATIDPNGIMHALFFGGNGAQSQLYYTRAHVDQAGLAPGWTTPQEIAVNAGAAGAIRVDQENRIHVLYGRSEYGTPGGVEYTYSIDDAATWSQPQQILTNEKSSDVVANFRMDMDAQGRLHATWSLWQDIGRSDAVYYARLESLDAGWSQPIVVAKRQEGDYEADWANIKAVGEDEIHILMQCCLGSSRQSRWSTDGGQTWSAPQEVFGVTGENGLVGPMAVDSAYRLHAVTHGRYYADGREMHGMFYIPWEGDHWGNRVTIAEKDFMDRSTGVFDPQHPQLVSYLGNKLLMVVANDPPNGFWYSVADTGSPPVAPIAYPPPLVVAPAEVETISPIVTISETPSNISHSALDKAVEHAPQRTTSPTFAVWFGVLPVVLLIGLVVALRIRTIR